ncbi:hypothetical protein ES703_47148 [subsurface metagenome]
MYAVKQNKKRMLLSLLIALFFHGMIFLTFQYLLPVIPDEIPEYTGPMLVTIERPWQPVKIEKEAVIIEKKSEAVQSPELEAQSVELIEKQDKIPGPETRVIQQQLPPVSTIEEKDVRIESDEAVVQDLSGGFIKQDRPQDVRADDAGILPPIPKRPYKEEEKDASIPFQPSSEITGTLTFDPDQLDGAIEKGQETLESAEEVKTAEKKKEIISPETPLIVWDDASSKRILTSSGSQPEIEIPYWVKREGLDLRVGISFAVTPEGHTTPVEIRISSGYSDVDTAILDAVRKMTFNPDPGSKIVTGTITYIISPK